MIFNRLVLENIGVFCGRIEFDLKPVESNKRDRPIVLFGGMNGSGKTTIFEAIKLCLYGKNAFNSSISQMKYDNEILSRFHNCSGTLSPYEKASIELELEYGHLGIRSTYNIIRSWQKKNSNLNETLLIMKDNVRLEDVDEEQWQNFIHELIPLGLSRLFFFDGEKIQQLAEDTSGAIQLGDSFRSLMGLDLVERLQADLNIVLNRESDKLGSNETKKISKQLQSEKDLLSEEKRLLIEKRASYQSETDPITARIEQQEQRIASEGGNYAKHRDEMVEKQNSLKIEIKVIEDKLRVLAQGLLPLSLTPKYCKLVSEQLMKEEEYEKWTITIEMISNNIKDISNIIQKGDKLYSNKLTNIERKNLVKQISKQVIKSLKLPKKFESFKPLHNFSARERILAFDWFEKSNLEMINLCKELAKNYEKHNLNLQKTEQKILRAPNDDQLGPLIKNLNDLNQKRGEMLEKLRRIDEDINNINKKLEYTDRRINKTMEELGNIDGLVKRFELINKVKHVLDDFQIKLTQQKVGVFKKYLQEYFLRLSDGKNSYSNILIDPDNFKVNLISKNKKQISKEQLSAGEKQIYSVATLWSLAKTSGRSLPFIIDTPLGRLDSIHRRNMMVNFFRYASHQVIVFSTDTEIDKTYFENLSPYISRTYHLSYDTTQENTVVESGYFWRKPSEDGNK